MIFPDGSLTVPVGSNFRFYGSFLDIEDLDGLLARTDFDTVKHQQHAAGWSHVTPPGSAG